MLPVDLDFFKALTNSRFSFLTGICVCEDIVTFEVSKGVDCDSIGLSTKI